MKFCIGDKVKIKDTDGIYPKYLAYLNNYSYGISDEILSKFRYSYVPENNEKEDEYEVEFVGQHLTCSNVLCVITSSEHTFIIGENSLEFLPIEEEEEEAEPKKGDSVKVIDDMKCYTTYEHFMLKYKENIGSKIFWRYRYNQSYNEFYKNNKDYGFTVRFVANHVDRPEEGKLAVISNGRDTFLFQIDGLQKI